MIRYLKIAGIYVVWFLALAFCCFVGNRMIETCAEFFSGLIGQTPEDFLIALLMGAILSSVGFFDLPKHFRFKYGV